jgi:hypothetical protein
MPTFAIHVTSLMGCADGAASCLPSARCTAAQDPSGRSPVMSLIWNYVYRPNVLVLSRYPMTYGQSHPQSLNNLRSRALTSQHIAARAFSGNGIAVRLANAVRRNGNPTTLGWWC